MTAATAHIDVPNYPERFYDRVDTKLNLMKNAFLILTSTVADTLLVCTVYRHPFINLVAIFIATLDLIWP